MMEAANNRPGVRMIDGDEVKRRRIEMGWSQAQLAVYAGMAPSTLYRLETGKMRSINSDLLSSLAATLETSMDSLMASA
jgi:transcriptional regulator with XRE-family HTH domain